MIPRALVLAWLTLAIVGCSKPVPDYPYDAEPDPRSEEYVIGVPDVVGVRVWRHQELNAQVQVRPDGTITLPLAGDVVAAGRTPTELKRELVRRLGAFVKVEATAVTVEVVDIQSYRVTVSGNVLQPGVVDAGRYVTVGEAVALAGGPTEFAKPHRVVVVRTRPDGTVVRIPIRYDLVQEGRALEQDIVLLSGDLVYVP